MPGATSNLALPYPLLSDPADIVVDGVQPLADAIDAGLVHVGDIKMTARSSAPSGWLLCDGSAVNRTTYAALFAAIGTAYGTGNGTTTFNLPDLRGRAPIGAGTGSGLSAKTLGAKVGSEPSNMPVHNHGGGAHSHTPVSGSGAFFTDAGSHYGFAAASGAEIAFAAMGNPGSFLTSQGSGSATDGNVPPSQVVNFVIRT